MNYSEYSEDKYYHDGEMPYIDWDSRWNLGLQIGEHYRKEVCYVKQNRNIQQSENYKRYSIYALQKVEGQIIEMKNLWV